MSDAIGTYSFLPWLRQGIANRIESADGDTSVRLRATVDVEFDLTARAIDGADVTIEVSRQVALYGPGDIIGIESSAIIQNEPRNWITNFEPNYLPYVVFYDEDFPWRYSPAAPDTTDGRLRPWLTLVVLSDGEFSEGRDVSNKPLPFVDVIDPVATFPAADELWAFAHVHVNRDLVGGSGEDPRSSDMATVLPAFQAILDEDPDLAYSRLVSPRKLIPNTRYHAFLMPTFESGRLAGLGMDPGDAPAEVHATFSAWAGASRPSPTLFPYYHRWFFRTGERGDFEYLVRLLEPKPADHRVGRRDIDVQRPGSNVDGIEDPDLGGVLKLGGALRVPVETLNDDDRAEFEKFDQWAQPYPHDFQKDLAALIDLADDYAAETAAVANQATGLDGVTTDPDPLITAPLYARWHALTARLLKDRAGAALPNDDNWVHELNLDPRWRCAGGFGTKVIQENQEIYMDAAWKQVGDVLEANELLRQAQLSREATLAWYAKTVLPLAARGDDRFFAFSAPMQTRVLLDGVTSRHRLIQSPIPGVLTSAPLRRMLRPRARLMRMTPFTAAARPVNLLERVNAGTVLPAPPKVVPPELPTVDELADAARPSNVSPTLWNALKRYPWLRFVPFVLALLIVLLAVVFAGLGLILTALAVAAGLAYFGLILWRIAKQAERVDLIRPENQTPDAVDALPNSPTFTVLTVFPAAPGSVTPLPSNGADSAEGVRFKAALKDAFVAVQTGREATAVAAPIPIDLAGLASATVRTIDPRQTIPRFALDRVRIPGRLRPDLTGPVDPIRPVMAYPEFDIPMYEPLSALSSEMLVPNLNQIEENSITLLETNQKFIEAYMVGINHEFARELLWREYPTDQRGSYFRQFWDPSAPFGETVADEEALRESLKDIPPIHTWRSNTNLGDHDHREIGGDNEEELVLVIRGELLKKYPNAVIYAQRAKWQRNDDGTIDNTVERRFEESGTPASRIKNPLYEARVAPDIFFFGFDLTAVEARGGIGDDETDDPGWFFIIQERPGEPRFGLDIGREGQLNAWNDLAWSDVLANPSAGGFLTFDSLTPLSLTEPTAPEVQEKHPQWTEDRFLTWRPDTNAAELAYILFQAPVLVAVHAAEMLPPAES